MNARTNKEIRSLLPAFAATVAVTVVTAGICDGSDAWGIVSFVFGGGCVLMGACCFGNEFYTRTMTSMLAQPVSRGRLWREKMQVLGGALAAGYAVWFLSIRLILAKGEAHPENFAEVAWTMLLVPVIVFCSTPGISLAVKNILGAMGATVMFPLSLWLMILAADWLFAYVCSRPELFLADSFDKHPGCYVAGLTLGYSALAYWLGWEVFKKFEALDSQGREVKFPLRLENIFARGWKRLVPEYRTPFGSLIRKELELQRLSFMMAVLLCVWLPLAAAVWALHQGEMASTLLIAPFSLYVLLIPLLTGVVCVAEERNSGTANWQFTLPPAMAKQWRAKILVTLATCVGLGVVLPALLLAAGRALFDMHIAFTTNGAFWIVFFFGYLLLFSLVIFASSIATNSMRAIIAFFGLLSGGGALAALIGYLTLKMLGHWNNSDFLTFQWLRDWLIARQQTHPLLFEEDMEVFICAGAASILFGLLMLWFLRMASANFRNGELNPRRVVRQMSWISVVVGMLSLAAHVLVFAVQRAAQ